MQLKAQNAVFDHVGVGYTAIPFLKTSPVFPSPAGTGTALQVGFDYTRYSQRLLLYGGGMRNLWHKTGTFKPWMTWQEQMQFMLNAGMSSAAMNYNPGIRYLANRHNWSGYQSIFGLRERETFVQVSDPETGGTQVVENQLPKDAIISFGYPHTTPDPQKSRLIFETIETDTTGNTADQQTELATLTHKGNLGFGTADPQARIDIRNNQNILGNEKIFSVWNTDEIERFSIKIDQDGMARIWTNYNPNTPPNAFHNYFGGHFRVFNPEKTTNGLVTEGSTFNFSSTMFFSRFDYGDKMNLEQGESYLRLFDKNTEYLICGNNGIRMPALKTNNGNISYLTVDAFGNIGNSASFPNPNTAWSYEGNTYMGTNDLLFGTSVGSTKDKFSFILQGYNVGEFSTNIRVYAPYTAQNKEANFRIKGTAVFGGMATLQYPMPKINDAVTLQLTGVNRWSDFYNPPNIPDFQPVSSLIQGFKPLVDLSMNQVGQVQTFNLFQSGVMELGEISTANNGLNVFSSPLRYNSVLSIGGVSTIQTLKYAIATYKPGDMSIVRFGVGYNNSTIYLGKSEIKDISASSGTNPEKLEVKASLIPFGTTSGNTGFDLGSSSRTWNDVWAKGSNIATSDRRLKKDITKIQYGLTEVLRLNPVSYHYLDYQNNDNLRLGFIAQELEEILPNTVVVGEETDSSFLGVRYEEIIPVLTKAIQEQQVIIQKQQQEIEIIKSKISIDGKAIINTSNGALNKLPILFQNSPNPFSETTAIDYFIPENYTQASIVFTDPLGKIIYSYIIDHTGMGRVLLNDDKINQGIYYYSLYANGKLVDTKQLSVVKH